MDTLIFEKFRQECNEKLPKVIDEILSMGKEENLGAKRLIFAIRQSRSGTLHQPCLQ